MKTKIICKNILVAALVCLFASCASTKFDGRANLVGRVCDADGKPVKDYHINAGLGLNALTDESGMFIIRDLKAGSYHIEGGGYGWRVFEDDIPFYDRKMIVCIQAESLRTLMPELSSLLDDKKIGEAKELLQKSKKYNEKNRVFDSYQKLIKLCEFPTEENKKAFFDSLRNM